MIKKYILYNLNQLTKYIYIFFLKFVIKFKFILLYFNNIDLLIF